MEEITDDVLSSTFQLLGPPAMLQLRLVCERWMNVIDSINTDTLPGIWSWLYPSYGMVREYGYGECIDMMIDYKDYSESLLEYCLEYDCPESFNTWDEDMLYKTMSVLRVPILIDDVGMFSRLIAKSLELNAEYETAHVIMKEALITLIPSIIALGGDKVLEHTLEIVGYIAYSIADVAEYYHKLWITAAIEYHNDSALAIIEDTIGLPISDKLSMERLVEVIINDRDCIDKLIEVSDDKEKVEESIAEVKRKRQALVDSMFT